MFFGIHEKKMLAIIFMRNETKIYFLVQFWKEKKDGVDLWWRRSYC